MKGTFTNPHYKYVIRFGKKWLLLLKKAPVKGETLRRNADYDWKEYVPTDDGEFSGSEEEQESNVLLRQTTLDDAGARKARIDALKKQAEEAQKMAQELEKAEAEAQINHNQRQRPQCPWLAKRHLQTL